MRLLLAVLLACLALGCSPSGRETEKDLDTTARTALEVRGREKTAQAARSDDAPPECVSVLRAMLDYAFHSKKDILTDREAQSRFLTTELAGEFLENEKLAKQERERRPTDRIDSPSNSDLYGFWDPPSEFEIVGSRRYGDYAVIDVLYISGPGTQYEGDKELASYGMKLSEVGWRVDDVYHVRGSFIPRPFSLSQELQSPL